MRSAGAGASASSAAAERRLVSVLFADLVGFTPFAEDRDPEAVRETLDRYFGLARAAVERHGGTVEKFIGDAVMALWGAPIAREDDAERAVRAALDLVDGVRGLGQGFEARAGVLTGEAAVTMGEEGQGMVAGDLVNTASRLQSVAPAATVLVGATTMRAASAAIAFEPAGEQTLKGKSAPVEAFRALRIVAQRGGHKRAEGLEPPFVGRDEELRTLKELVEATTRDRRVRLVTVSGTAGIGKSRLTWELEKYLDGMVEDIYWHRGRSPAYGEGITFWALGEMVRRRAGLAESDDEPTTRERVAATVGEYVPDPEDRRWVEPALLALLGLEPSPSGGRDVLFAAWRIFFEHIADRGTTVLLFEDLQWADGGLLDFIDHLLQWSKNLPILVIALARPELFDRRPDWGAAHRLMTALPLEPLPEVAMRELLAGLVPGLPDQAVATIVGRADGIPLYAVETVRMLLAEGRIEAIDGVHRPTGDLGDIAVPETLRSLIASRLDALERIDRSLLQDAAVLGQRFTVAGLAAISGLPAEELEARLRALVKRELLDLEADPRSPERGQYGFVQGLIREVAYGTLARRERRTRHLAAARYFEALGDDELAGALAAHYLAAFEASGEGAEADAVAVQARLALRGAAERAAALGGHDQSVAYLEQALTVTADPLERAELLERAADSADAASRYEAAERYAREAIDLHAEAGRDAEAGRTRALLGRILIDAGDLPGATGELEDGLGRLSEGAADEAMAELLAHLSRALMRSGEYQRSIETADRALAIAERLNLAEVVSEAFNNKASSLSYLGRRREGAALLEMAVRMAEQGGWIAGELRARNNLFAAISWGEPRRGMDILLGGVDLARRVGHRGMFSWSASTAAWSMYWLGDDWDAGLALLDEVLTGAVSPYDGARAMAIGAAYAAARGERLAELIPALEEALPGGADPGLRAILEYHRADVYLITGDADAAYEAAMRSAEFPGGTDTALSLAARAAMWGGRVDQLRAALDAHERQPSADAWNEAVRRRSRAGLDALEGRVPDALEGFRAALDAFRRIEVHWESAWTGLDALRLLQHEPDARRWAAEVRPIFERLRARPYLESLDASLAAEAAPAAPSAKRSKAPGAVAAGTVAPTGEAGAARGT